MLKYLICSVHWCLRAGCSRLWFYTSTAQGIGEAISSVYTIIKRVCPKCPCPHLCNSVDAVCLYSSSAGRGRSGWLIGSKGRISMDIWLWMSKSVATSSPKQHQYQEGFQLVLENSACSTHLLNARLCCNIQYFNMRKSFFALVILLKTESHLWMKVMLTSRALEHD